MRFWRSDRHNFPETKVGQVQKNLLYQWEQPVGGKTVLVDDETLRDGLQDPSCRQPSCEAKKEYLHLIAELGVQAVDLGMPAASPQVEQEVEALLREIATWSLGLAANCAVRTLERDVLTCAAISHRVGFPLEVMLFLGFSSLRRTVEGWDRDFLLRKLELIVRLAVREGLSVTFVAEDASRTSPGDLEAAVLCAVRAGVSRICLADTTGVLSPRGAEKLVAFTRTTLRDYGFQAVQLDWHGHNDRGLGLACALAAAGAGATRLHGTLLGVGERAGNPPLEQLLLNLHLLGFLQVPEGKLVPNLLRAADLLGLTVPPKAPVLGELAFATATGVHASAIFKAKELGCPDFQELVYNPFPPSWLGTSQRVLIGPYSGSANVRYWLLEHGLPVDPAVVKAILAAAKKKPMVLPDQEILEIIQNGEGEEGLS